MHHLGREKCSHVHQESWRSLALSVSFSLQQPTLTLQRLEPVFRAGTTRNQISSQNSKKPLFDVEEVVSFMEYPWGFVHKQGIWIAFLKEQVTSNRQLLGTSAPSSRFVPCLQQCVAKYKQNTITFEWCASLKSGLQLEQNHRHICSPQQSPSISTEKQLLFESVCRHCFNSQDTQTALSSLF